MRRVIPQIVLFAGYLAIIAAALLIDVRAALFVIGVVLVYEGREAQP